MCSSAIGFLRLMANKTLNLIIYGVLQINAMQGLALLCEPGFNLVNDNNIVLSKDASCLYVASKYGFIEIVQHLLECGAQVNDCNEVSKASSLY